MPSLRGRAAPASESAGPRVDRETGSHASASLVSNVVVLQKRRETQPSGQLGCLDPVSSVSVVPLARAHNGVGDGVGVGQQHGVQGRVRAEGLRVGASACEGTSSWTMTSSRTGFRQTLRVVDGRRAMSESGSPAGPSPRPAAAAAAARPAPAVGERVRSRGGGFWVGGWELCAALRRNGAATWSSSATVHGAGLGAASYAGMLSHGSTHQNRRRGSRTRPCGAWGQGWWVWEAGRRSWVSGQVRGARAWCTRCSQAGQVR